MPTVTDEWIGGDVADGFGGVADAFRSNFRTRREVGAAVTVYRDGEKARQVTAARENARRTLEAKMWEWEETSRKIQVIASTLR